MKFFSRLSAWQKGAFSGFLFTVFIAFVYTLVVIVFDIFFETQGLPHYCYQVVKTVECSMVDAIFSRLGLFIVMILVFGLPITAVGGFIGYIFQKVVYRE